MQINITAIIKALPEKGEEMKALLLKLVEGSTKEVACIQYDLHQSAEEPNIFIFHEIWRDADSLAEHTQTQHFLEFVNDSSPLLAEPLTVYKTNRV